MPVACRHARTNPPSPPFMCSQRGEGGGGEGGLGLAVEMEKE